MPNTPPASQPDYPAANGQPVTERHARLCREQGHAPHLVDGRDTGVCARCGEVTEPAAQPNPTATVWRAQDGTEETIERIHHYSIAHYPHAYCPGTAPESPADRIFVPVQPDPLADEKKLLGLVVDGLQERRQPREATSVEDWGAPASEAFEASIGQHASRRPSFADRARDDLRAQAGTLYPTCSAWALAKLDEKEVRGTPTRVVLLALAADADRGLHSPNGYNGTTVSRLRELVGRTLGHYRTVANCDRLREMELIVETDSATTDDEVRYRLPERFLAYMRD